MKVAVIGAGIHGVSSALELALRGHEVTVFEKDEPASKQGSSHGRSRIVRKAYPDPLYTSVMEEAFPLWDRLQQASQESILHTSGLVYFGSSSSPTLASVLQSLKDHGVPHQVSADCSGWLPNFRFQADEIGIFTPDAGWVHAERAVQSTWKWAVSLGAVLCQRDITAPEDLEKDFDRIVVCVGCGIRRWFEVPVEVRVQTIAYVNHVSAGSVWIEDGLNFNYGFPTSEGESSTKVGVHNRGTKWSEGTARPNIDPISLACISDFAKQRWGIENAEIVETATCIYTMAPNEDFMWGQSGEKILWVSACSGHGFKFGPWIGKSMADFVEGKASMEAFVRFFRNIARRGT